MEETGERPEEGENIRTGEDGILRKKRDVRILKGTIISSRNRTELEICENSYLVCEDGKAEGIYRTLPFRLGGYPIRDFGDCLIIPGLVDLHTHAPQYSFRGTALDLELLDWLEVHTFPEEIKYGDMEYAGKAYEIFAERMQKSAVTRACIFATIHRPATMMLMDLMEKSGLVTMVGKVNMDRNAPEGLCEGTEDSLAETEAWLKEATGRLYVNTTPILTPRFVPSCTDRLMEGLGELQRKYFLPVQSHLSENPEETAWVKELCPWSEFYGDAYDHFGLFGRECPTIMAHCVYSGEEEIHRMKENGVFIAHCPESNMNVSSGIAPVKQYLDEGLHVGLGSDVAAGSTENLFAAMAHAVRASKIRWRIQDDRWKPLTMEEVFYMATQGGGAFFGKVGSFKPGYEFDAVVLDDSRLSGPRIMSARDRLERVIYLGDEREVRAKYVRGKELFF